MEEKSYTIRKIALIILLLSVIFWIGFERKKKRQVQKKAALSSQNTEQKSPEITSMGDADFQSDLKDPNQAAVQESADSSVSNLNPEDFIAPIDRASERVTKKRFGQHITLQNSPVQPEKFSGYHAGTDFEIFPGEENTDVSIRAVCGGKILTKRSASGYGGILVQRCDLDEEPVTVIYGHIKLRSITKNINEHLAQGEQIGFLGIGQSAETDGERKHLHLGIHKGSDVNILGYVPKQSDLSNWLNPCHEMECQ